MTFPTNPLTPGRLAPEEFELRTRLAAVLTQARAAMSSLPHPVPNSASGTPATIKAIEALDSFGQLLSEAEHLHDALSALPGLTHDSALAASACEVALSALAETIDQYSAALDDRGAA